MPYCFIFLAFAPIIDLKEIDWQEFVEGKGIWLLIIPLLLFILNGLLSSGQKAVISFWRFKNPLPACRSFSVYAQRDDRVDFKRLEEKRSPLPQDAKEQNSLWYRIYKTFQEEPVVKKSHKDFLLGRDMCFHCPAFFSFWWNNRIIPDFRYH